MHITVAWQENLDIFTENFICRITAVIRVSVLTICIVVFCLGVIVGQYLQNVTQRLALGSEILYQCGPTVPGNHIAVFTLAGRYTGEFDAQASCSSLLMTF